MVGRKRKSGRRKPSGRLVQERRENPRDVVAAQPHRRRLPKNLRTDERAESELGRLYLAGLGNPDAGIDEDRYNAGTRFAAAVARYRETIETPRANPGAGSGRSFACGAVADGHCDPATCACLKRRIAYTDAYDALAAGGQRTTREVSRVAVHGDSVTDLALLRAGLGLLARHFGFYGR